MTIPDFQENIGLYKTVKKITIGTSIKLGKGVLVQEWLVALFVWGDNNERCCVYITFDFISRRAYLYEV